MAKLKADQKSMRIVLPEALYDKLRIETPEHGDISKLIRRLLIKYLDSVADEGTTTNS